MVEAVTAPENEQNQGAPGKKRERTAIEFPYADLTRSAELTATLGEAGGKVWIDQTQLAVALDMSANGGTFRSRLSAAKMFGFLETGGGKVRLSDLGIRLLDEATSRAAKVEAFLNVPLYQAMYDSYNGFALPPAAAIERQMASMGVPTKQAERARQAFASSAQAAGFIASNGRFSKPMLAPAEAKDDVADQKGGGGSGGGGAGNGDGGGGGKIDQKASDLPTQLLELLDPENMSDEEQKAVWTLLLYVKKPKKNGG
jgi:hypothetical protein